MRRSKFSNLLGAFSIAAFLLPSSVDGQEVGPEQEIFDAMLAARIAYFEALSGEKAKDVCVIPSKDESGEVVYYTPSGTKATKVQEQLFNLHHWMTSMSPIGKMLGDFLVVSEALVCRDNDKPEQGHLDFNNNHIMVNFFDGCSGVNYAEEEYADDLLVQLFLKITYLEEAAHGYQNAIKIIASPSIGGTQAGYDLLWLLSLEAHAKLITSVAIVEAATTLEQLEDLNKLDGNFYYEKSIKMVAEIYRQNSADDIKANPDLLRPVFEMILSDPVFLEDYFEAAPQLHNTLYGKETPPFKIYKTAFSKLPGFKGDMLEGIDSFEQIINMLPADSETSKFVKARFAGDYSYKVKPTMPEDKDVDTCYYRKNYGTSPRIFKFE